MIHLKNLYQLTRAIKQDIYDDYQAFEEDEVPGIQLTIGFNPEDGTWSFQTGDNAFMGSAYHYPIWAVCGVYRSSNCGELARILRDEILDQMEG